MIREIRDRWIRALRSRRYEQIQNVLKSGNKYCCLGVLSCVVSKKRKILGKHTNGEDGLSSGLLKSVGLSRRQHNTLIELNDTKELSFEAIADYIEKFF